MKEKNIPEFNPPFEFMIFLVFYFKKSFLKKKIKDSDMSIFTNSVKFLPTPKL
jgi:hypothetical protein